MNIKSIIKATPFYKYIYLPYSHKKRKEFKKKRHELFLQEGMNALSLFCQCLNDAEITYWMEFGTLLGAYRDNAFVPNELDLDMGAYISDSERITELLQNVGFRLVREFHIVGEQGLEQTFEFRGTTLDVMYFFEKNGFMYCTGSDFDLKDITGKPFFATTTSHRFKKFGVTNFEFHGIHSKVPSNTEEHLIEIYGSGYKVYDPNFKGDLNKKYYTFSEKKSIGFVIY